MRHSDESLAYRQIIRALLFIFFCQPVAADDHVTRRVMSTCELQYEYALLKNVPRVRMSERAISGHFVFFLIIFQH